MSGALRNSQDGFLYPLVLFGMGIISVTLVTHFSLLQHELSLVERTTGRAQALYLAEAGLDAANDLLSQDWLSYHDTTRFPMRERLAASSEGQPIAVGEFEVVAREIDAVTLECLSTGRSLPFSGEERSAQPRYRIERTLSMIVVQKRKPLFQHVGPPGILELEASYFNKDSFPDLVVLSGNVVPGHGWGRSGRILPAEPLHAWGGGRHLFASFTDVDLDGDLDLVVADPLSRAHERRRASSSGDELLAGLQTLTAGDLLGMQQTVPVVAHGWLWLPEEALSELEPGADVFLNTPIYDGTLIVSWTEQRPTPH